MSALNILVLFATTIGVCAFSSSGRSWFKTLPPGPRPKPFIGNLFDMPRAYEWLTYARWAKVYGDCMSFTVFGKRFLVLNSIEAASDLLEKRSAKYSSRPRLVMAGELVGFNHSMALMPYSDRFRELRRLITRELSGHALQKYWPLHEQESRRMIGKALADPSRLTSFVRHYSGSVILRVTYGYRTEPENDPYLELSHQTLRVLSETAKPGAWLVDIIPCLRFLPSWLPGMSFKSRAAHWKELRMQANKGAYAWSMEHQDSATLSLPNFVSTILDKHDGTLDADQQDALLWASASLFGGGADTSVAVISTFYLAMALHPEVQRRAQAEIAHVIGHNRLPSVADRDSLPYIESIMYEVLRWRPVAPLGLAHLSTEDDEYHGMHVPRGSVVIPNIWSMTRDSSVFTEPETFEPARFLDNQAAKKHVASVFGFGRRACPGMHFAEVSAFIAIATALATCDIRDARHANGDPVTRNIRYASGTICHPPPFTCSLRRRNDAAAHLLDADLS